MDETQLLEVNAATGNIGGVVSFSSLAELVADEDSVVALKRALFQYGVLFLPGAVGGTRQFGDFARMLGRVVSHGAYPCDSDDADIQLLENKPGEDYKIEVWHSDMTFAAAPPAITTVRARVLPPVGGDTVWASAAAAYDALASPMRSMLDGLTAVHDFRYGFRESLAEPGGLGRLADVIAANPPVSHPVVLSHPITGRRALFVNPLFTTKIKELSASESEHLLKFLYAHIVREEFSVRLKWQVDTIAVWDNRLVQHKPVNDFGPVHRLLQRATIA